MPRKMTLNENKHTYFLATAWRIYGPARRSSHTCLLGPQLCSQWAAEATVPTSRTPEAEMWAGAGLEFFTYTPRYTN